MSKITQTKRARFMEKIDEFTSFRKKKADPAQPRNYMTTNGQKVLMAPGQAIHPMKYFKRQMKKANKKNNYHRA